MRFFLYGMLLPDSGHPLAARLAPVMVRLGPASARGRLYAIPDPGGWYPAMVRAAGGPGHSAVHGAIYGAAADFTGAHLAAMDAFEGFDPTRPDAGDYIRGDIDVAFAGSRTRTEAYLWRAPLPPGARPIPGGRFQDFLDSGNAPYRGA